MVKYKCNDCGKTFKGDYSTKSCPECKSKNITEVKSLFANKTNRMLLIAIAAVIVVVAVVLVVMLNPSEVKAELTEDETTVTVTVSGVDVEDLQSLYQVQIYTEEGESHDVLFFEDNPFVVYEKSRLLPGKSYTFELEKIGGGGIENLVYPIENRKVTMPDVGGGDTLNFPPQILEVKVGVPNRRTQRYNEVTIRMSQEGQYTYEVSRDGGEVVATQETNVFKGLAPGDYVAKVRNGNGEETMKPFVLPDIVEEGKKLELSEVQATFDKLAHHQIRLGAARSKLATSDVNLAHRVGECTTLFEALVEADSFGSEFTVVSFDTDASGRIKSGTLVLKYK